MKKHLLISIFSILLCLLSGKLFCQQEVHFDHGCNFTTGRTAGTYTLFDPSKEAEQMVNDILGVFRIKPRPFTLKKSDVKNAQATTVGTERYVLYSGQFLSKTTTSAQTLWAAKGVFAHEIAHHALLQDLTEKNPKKRRAMELAADMWAARVLARMKATKEEALSAIKTLKLDTDTLYYPTLEARLEGMEAAFDEEYAAIKKDEGVVEAGNKKPFQIDPASYNRWCIVNKGAIASFYNDEKITININISPVYANKKITVLLCSNDPYMPIRTVKGTGAYLPYASTMQITWNFQLDNVTLNNAIRPNQLRVLVYESEKLPPAKGNIGTKVGLWSLGIAGLGIAGYSFKLRSDAKNHYNTNYKKTLSESDYEMADKKYVNSQYVLAGGAVLATLGTVLIVNKIKRQKEAKKAICFAKPTWKMEPLVAAGGNFGVGFLIRF